MFEDGIPEAIRRYERAGKTACPDCGEIVTKGIPYTREHDLCCAPKAGAFELDEWLAARRYIWLRRAQARVERLHERVCQLEAQLR